MCILTFAKAALLELDSSAVGTGQKLLMLARGIFGNVLGAVKALTAIGAAGAITVLVAVMHLLSFLARLLVVLYG